MYGSVLRKMWRRRIRRPWPKIPVYDFRKFNQSVSVWTVKCMIETVSLQLLAESEMYAQARLSPDAPRAKPAFKLVRQAQSRLKGALGETRLMLDALIMKRGLCQGGLAGD